MAKKPLVWGTNGRPEELASGDILDAVVQEKDLVSLVNANGSAIVIGTPVYKTTTSNEVNLARANASGTTNVIGLVAEASIASSASGLILTDGVLEATTGEWDVVTGQTGGLTPGSEYWLSFTTAGMLTTSVPGAGSFLVRVGTAISSTQLEVSIDFIGKKA